MNLKLLSLMKKAGFVFWEDEDWKPEDAVIDWSTNYDKEIEMFAELIVKECVSIGDNYQDILVNEPECFNCRKVAYGIVDKIKQHFGVEE